MSRIEHNLLISQLLEKKQFFQHSDNHLKIFANFSKNINNLIPGQLDKIFKSINAELYAVGGCVRDMLLGKQPKDIDLCTNLTPEQVIEICTKNHIKTIPTGIEHGTITAIVNNEQYEITTYRTDAKTDGRHANVQFISDIKEDLARRDFTINAMAIDCDGKIEDPFDGQIDLGRKIIRAVGDAKQRFREDYLRIIRAARFCSTYNFKIAKDTYTAMQQCIPELISEISINNPKGKISIERISDEIGKSFNSSNSETFLKILFNLGVLENISEDFSSDTMAKIYNCINNVQGQDRWVILFIFINPDNIENIVRKMKLPLTNLNFIIKAAKLRQIIETLLQSNLTPNMVREFQTLCGSHLESLSKIYKAIYDHPGIKVLFEEMERFNNIVQGRDILEIFPDKKPGAWVGELLRKVDDYHKNYFYEHGINPGKDQLINVIKELAI